MHRKERGYLFWNLYCMLKVYFQDSSSLFPSAAGRRTPEIATSQADCDGGWSAAATAAAAAFIHRLSNKGNMCECVPVGTETVHGQLVGARGVSFMNINLRGVGVRERRTGVGIQNICSKKGRKERE